MIDALREEASVQCVPMGCFVSVNGTVEANAVRHACHRVALVFIHISHGMAATLAHDHYYLTLAILHMTQTTILTVFFFVGGFDVAAEVSTVDFHFAAQLGAFAFLAQGFADFMRENESGFVLNVKVAGKLQGAVALGAVHEDGNSGENVAQRKLAAGEDGAGGHAELAVAALALEDAARGVTIDGHASAARAERLAFVG